MSGLLENGLLALDWGTSSLRGALLDAQGAVLQERAFARGILSVPPGGFPAVLAELFGDWLQGGGATSAPPRLCLIAGMAGSQQGWQEAPYCPCPAGFAELSQRLAWIDGAKDGAEDGLEVGRIAIVPGLSCEHAGCPDVMRGEETQVFGALQLLGLQDATCVLPGTHSKWVQVRGGRITGFATFMTGEFYALLRQHSILARTLPAQDGALDEAAFDAGVAHALQGTSLLNTAFSTRTLALFRRREGPALASYLSGLVIGEELRAQPAPAAASKANEANAADAATAATAAVATDATDSAAPLVLIGAPALTARYQRALAQRHLAARCIGAEATWHGLWALASTLTRDNTP